MPGHYKLKLWTFFLGQITSIHNYNLGIIIFLIWIYVVAHCHCTSCLVQCYIIILLTSVLDKWVVMTLCLDDILFDQYKSSIHQSCQQEQHEEPHVPAWRENN